ncbi:MAG: type I secretion system permease/ATPase [Alphaproteobacteria bacterium CG11_big_fil_rev_8_21_14_0_20_39_49]|nr:MAG: type I secretion system permease/ATPase [Alphaproteobacteria bacterium CG11_big_fil_rev_8_21_14_0_20_39_49]
MKQKNNILTEALQTVKPVFLYMGIFSFFINAFMLLLPIYSLQVLDRVLSTGSMETLLWLSVIVVISLLISGVLQIVRSFSLIKAGEWIDNSLSHSLLTMSIIKAAKTGIRGTQNIADLNIIRSFFTGNGLLTIFDAPWSFIFLIFIYLIHSDLGNITLLGSILFLVMAWANELAMHKSLDEANENNIKNLQHVDIAMRNAEVIEAMGMTDALADRWHIVNKKVMGLQSLASYRSSVLQAITKFIRMTLQIAIIGWGAYLAVNNQISTGSIIAASILAGRAFAPFESAISTWNIFIESYKSYKRLNSSLMQMETRDSGISMPPPEGNLTVEKLVYIIPQSDKPVLKGVSFQLDSGDALGVIGASAAGKSTLCKLITGAIAPYAGVVRLDGGDVCRWRRNEFGQHIGYLPQSIELFSGTIKDNIARMAQDAPDEYIIKAAQMAGIHELILSLPNGYDTDVGNGGAAISAGQRQRIGLARALFGEPKVLVLDEPDANLDMEGEAALQRVLQRAKENKTTVLVITHRKPMLKYFNKLLVLDKGEVSMFGHTQAVLASINNNAPILQKVS